MFRQSRGRWFVAAGAVVALGLATTPIAVGRTELSGSIVFASFGRGASTSDLYAVDASGVRLRQLTNTPDLSEQQPAVTRDGSRLVFRVADANLDPSSFELYTSTADGEQVTRLTTDAWAEESPAWTPDGRVIVFSSNRADANHDCLLPPCKLDLYSIRSDGSHERRLTEMEGGAAFFPSVSPDGLTVLFTFLTDAGDSALYVVGLDGHGLHQITTLAHEYFHGHWSPDGERIAFADNGCITCPSSSIWTMRVDGTHLVRLTDGGHEGTDYNPQWSPDGAWITFTREDARQAQIYRVRSGGGQETKVTTKGDYNFESVWSPN